MDRSVDVFGGSFAIAVRVHGTPADEPLPPGAARIIAFPGAGDNSGSFDSLAPLLTAEAPRHCLVAVDPPGCGHSDHRPAYDYYNDFEDCALTIEIADALGWPAHEPLVVLGHSRGGNIAATAAGAFADRINGALLLETNLGLNGVFITNIGQPQPPTVAAMVKSDARRRKRQRSSASRELSELVEKSMDFVRADGGHYSKSRETATAILRRGTEPHPDGGGVRHRGDPRASGVQCMMMDEASQQAYFRAIRCPSLLVISDTFVQHYDHHKQNPHYQLFMDRVEERRAAFGTSLEVVSLPGVSGHHHHSDQPQRTAEVLLPFLAKLVAQHSPPAPAPAPAPARAGGSEARAAREVAVAEAIPLVQAHIDAQASAQPHADRRLRGRDGVLSTYGGALRIATRSWGDETASSSSRILAYPG